MTTSQLGRISLAVLLLIGVGAAVVASRTDPEVVEQAVVRDRSGRLPVEAGAAPPVRADSWLNTPDGEAPQTDGRVVLYEFWTFGCSNCRAVLPHVRAWNERYGPDGLVVVSVHTPEFDYEADPNAVAAFVDEQDIRYPVALDPDRRVWRAFDNHYWPAFYLHDQMGRRRLTHFGEGSYEQTEDAIRALLDVEPTAPRAEVP